MMVVGAYFLKISLSTSLVVSGSNNWWENFTS